MNKPKLRFSLRLMFLAMTVLAAWLAWDMSIIRHRRALLATLDISYAVTPAVELSSQLAYRTFAAQVGSVRRLLGDEAIQFIFYPQNAEPEFVSTLQAAFPEATIQERPIAPL
jgi:hypothetical protein